MADRIIQRYGWLTCLMFLGLAVQADETSEISIQPTHHEVSSFLQTEDNVRLCSVSRKERSTRFDDDESTEALVAREYDPSQEPIFHESDEDEVFQSYADNGNACGSCDEWQVMPVGLMYKAYLAGEKESRMQAVWLSSKGRHGLLWETALGGHVGLLRYGTTNSVNPEGWQFDLEGAALPRVDMGNQDNLEAVDFRAGFLSTWRYGPNAYKVGYYHLSSHVGDEYLLENPSYHRLNYVRDSFIMGYTRDLFYNIQAYGEIAYAFNHEDGAKPIELQYGFQYSPMVFGLRGAPFAAINGHTREDFNYVTSINVQGGWQWRGVSNHTYRLGFQYYDGPAMQWEFAGRKEHLVGGGMWMDY